MLAFCNWRLQIPGAKWPEVIVDHNALTIRSDRQLSYNDACVPSILRLETLDSFKINLWREVYVIFLSV